MSRIARRVKFDVRDVGTEYAPLAVSCLVCGGGAFAFEQNMTGVNATKGRHRREHEAAVPYDAKEPEPLPHR